jgi:hypothetical protein
MKEHEKMDEVDPTDVVVVVVDLHNKKDEIEIDLWKNWDSLCKHQG